MASNLVQFDSLRLLVPILVCSFLSGCTSISDYVHNGFKVGPNFAKPSAPVAPQWIDASDKRVRQDSDDLSQWWSVFTVPDPKDPTKQIADPILHDLICHAYHQNLSLREAGFRVLQARAQYGIAVGEIFPQTQNASGNYTRTATSITAITDGPFGSAFGLPGTPPISQFYGMLTSNFNLAWELDFWGRFRRAIEASAAELDASVEGYDDVLVTLLGDVATNYVQLRVLQEQIELLKENARVQEKAVGILEKRLKAQTIDGRDPNQAKSTLYQTLAQIPQKEIAVRQTTNRLCVLLGIPPEDMETRLKRQPDELQKGRKKTLIPDADINAVGAGIPADLLRRRPDLRRAERQAAAQSARIGVATSQLYPHIAINGTFGWQAPHLNQLFTPLAFQGSYGPTFQWDVLNYGRLLNNVRFEKAKFEEAVTTYQNKVLTAAEEVENGMVMFLKAQKEVELLEKSVAASREVVRIGNEKMEAGTKFDFVQVSLLEQNLVQQDNLLAQAKGDVALGLIQVYRALGGGWQIRCNGCTASGAFVPACGLPGKACPTWPMPINGGAPPTAGAPPGGARASTAAPLLLPPVEQ
jgi:NodT family efflux transporter outer membrane factor (OMF) lipoprotein